MLDSHSEGEERKAVSCQLQHTQLLLGGHSPWFSGFLYRWRNGGYENSQKEDFVKVSNVLDNYHHFKLI